jgi:hypothetical protein
MIVNLKKPCLKCDKVPAVNSAGGYHCKCWEVLGSKNNPDKINCPHCGLKDQVGKLCGLCGKELYKK